MGFSLGYSRSSPCFAPPQRSPASQRRSSMMQRQSTMSRRGLATAGAMSTGQLPSLPFSPAYSLGRADMVPPYEDGAGCIVNNSHHEVLTAFRGRHSDHVMGFS